MINKFEQLKLDIEILKALKNLGFKKPSEVQVKAIPKLLIYKDIIVKSQTGSGKTASFGIPICQNIDIDNSSPQAIIIVPTRELALQVKEEISNIGRLRKIRCAAIFGRQPIKDQINELKQRVHVVVATPGRISDHIERKTIKLDDIKYLIIDEADKMLTMGFIEQIEAIIEHLPINRTTALFSATIDDNIQTLCDKYMKSTEILDVQAKVINKVKIDDSYISVEDKEKYETLKNVIYAKNPKSVIVFCNTRNKVRSIYGLMKRDNFLVEELHGEMTQNKRLGVIKNFKEDKFKVLVSTDVAARGIHIDDIGLVVNYEVPEDKENYIHRIGRTGRAGKTGEAISLVSQKEIKYFDEIKDYIGYDIKEDKPITLNEIVDGKIEFEKSQQQTLKLRRNKSEVKNVHSEVTKIYINVGKKKKIRVIDIVGAFSNLEGLTGEDIGVIEIQDLCSYIDILNNKGNKILKKYREIQIKKKPVKVRKATDK